MKEKGRQRIQRELLTLVGNFSEFVKNQNLISTYFYSPEGRKGDCRGYAGRYEGTEESENGEKRTK